MDFVKHRELGYGFLSGFPHFSLYRNCKRLREFEEIGISSKSVEVAVNNKSKTLKTFVRTSSKNSVSGCQQFNPPWPPSSPVLSPHQGPPPGHNYPHHPHTPSNPKQSSYHQLEFHAVSPMRHIPSRPHFS